MIKLGINIDHVATIRNCRREKYPDPLKAAIIARDSGADSITIHLREDRRHIIDKDLFKIVKLKNVKTNLEIAPTFNMLKIAIKAKPNFVCLVPEKRKELTTEGGLNLKNNYPRIKKIIKTLKKNGIRTSLFIEPKIEDVIRSKKLDTDCIEVHTGKFSNLINLKKNYLSEFTKIRRSVNKAYSIGLEVHAGHGLTYLSTKKIVNIKHIKELNIGHFIIGESIFFGLKKVIFNFKKIINK